MKSRYCVWLLWIALFVLLPCAAFALGTLTIGGSSYNSAALSGNPSGAGWAWSASVNGGQGELTLSGYDGGAIASADGILNIRLIGENIITTSEPSMLMAGGSNSGLNLYGSDPAVDRLIARSTAVVDSFNNTLYGIRVTISNSATIPFTFRNISFILDMSRASNAEYVSGFYYPYTFYGIYITQTINNPSILGIDMDMDNTVITMSNESTRGTFSYGMWASPHYSSIEAVFNSCTFNLSDFSARGWYTGRDLAKASSATYNNCLFNLHTDSTGAIGIHVSSDADSGFGVSTLTFNNPSGEIETKGINAVYARGTYPALAVNGASMQAWQEDGAEIVDPQIVTIFYNSSLTRLYARTVGIENSVAFTSAPNTNAARIIFTLLPPDPPQTGDSSAPALYALVLLLAAAGLVVLRLRAVRR